MSGHRGCEEFLYTIKAGPAGGLRPPSGPAAPRRAPASATRPEQPTYKANRRLTTDDKRGGMILTVELNDDQEAVEVTFDSEGLALLLERLTRLGQRDAPNHDHLKTPAWAGYELSEELQGGPRNRLVHHLRLQLVP
jgi:Immunity protein 32